MLTTAETIKPSYRLVPELVPRPLWGISAYRLLGRGRAWKTIRQAALEASDQQCSICGSTETGLTCHERWDYDDRHGTATLVGFEIHCHRCDAVTHMGRAVANGFAEEAIATFCRVNRVTKQEAGKAFRSAMGEWHRRSEKEWTITVAGPLLEQYPQLAILSGTRVSPTSSQRQTSGAR